jgi:ATP synthase subunit 6
MLFINLIVLLIFSSIVYFFSSDADYLGEVGYYFIPNTWQTFIEITYETAAQLVFDNLNEEGEKYFPFIAVLFTVILFNNLIGLVPYSFTITSHLIVTFALSFPIFIGVVIIGVQRHKINMMSVFLPANTPIGLGLLLVPIELISYIFKPISLGVRLFANLMAGHTLLKVIVGFSWSMLMLENFMS